MSSPTLSIRESRPPSVRRAVAQFAATGLGALIIVAVAGAFTVERLGTAASLRDGGTVAELVAHGAIEPAVTDALAAGDPMAIAALDRVVRERVLRGSLARIKLWTADGRIVYSDEPQLIGAVFPLGPAQAAALASGVMSEPHVSNLAAAENVHEDGAERLVEVYVPIQAPDGTPLLVESYLRLDSVLTSGRFVTGQLLPLVVLALAFLAVAQWPLAWRLARDLRVGHETRERLLRGAIESSESDRRRIAGDLHDGLVQSLAGVAFDLAGSADRTRDAEAATSLERGAEGVRAAMREARSVLVELYPPDLRDAGLAVAVTNLSATVSNRGIDVTVDVVDDGSLSPTDEAIVYRVVQEALRNVVKHSAATQATVRLHVENGRCDLEIEDDGVGVADLDLDARRQAGHLGLTVLRDLAADAGASLDIRPRLPNGTRLSLILKEST
jgi:two-component system NarL family sensor kinase